MELSPEENSPAIRKRKYSPRDTDQAPKIDISIPGLSKLFDRSIGITTKIIWLITLVVCGIVCMCLTVYQLLVYFQYPTASNTIIERKRIVKFPSISICPVSLGECYKEELIKEIEIKCQQKNITNCNTNKISFHQLGINLKTVWARCDFVSVNVSVVTLDAVKTSNLTDYKITKRHTNTGTCVTITHTKKVTYISAFTLLLITIISKNDPKLKSLLFCPHEEPEFNPMEYETIDDEMELVEMGYSTRFKLREEMFKLQNITGRECFDYVAEKHRIEQKAINSFSSKHCRLPFLPNNFPECDKLEDFLASELDYKSKANLETIENFYGRRICNQVIYGISTDFIRPIPPNNPNDMDNATTTTKITVKFADNTKAVVTEYYSYTFPALMSDLFAYWGFFLCLSALVFAEIIEFLFRKIYQYCKQRGKFAK